MLKQQSMKIQDQKLRRNNMFNEGDIVYHESLRSSVQ